MITKFFLLLIKIYQKVISPYLPSNCRYLPSCSRYSEDAINRYGFFRGGQLTVLRLLRCVPWGGKGFDPVP